MESEQGAGPGPSVEPSRAPSWPPPHPSPPPPPPREYGSPGTPPPPRAWLWAVGAAVVLGLLISGGLALVVSGLGDDGSVSTEAGAPSPAAPTSPVGDLSESDAPGPTAPASPESSASAPRPTYTCWDGTSTKKLKGCTLPHGEAGLRYAYPSMATERCGPAQYSRKDGALLRIVCRHVLTSGTKVQVGYYEWQSVEAAVAFFTGQGLATTQQDAGGYRFSGTADGTLKQVQLYAEVGFSQTITAPAGTQLAPEDLAALAQRPAAQLRGVQAD